MVMKLRSFLLVLYVSGISLAQAGNIVEAPSTKDKPNTLQAQPKSMPIPDEFKAKLKLANAGDEEAMVDVGLAYMDGTEFLAVNEQEAYRWFKKVAD